MQVGFLRPALYRNRYFLKGYIWFDVKIVIDQGV